MPKLALLVLVAVVVLLPALPAQANKNKICPTVRAGIEFYRNATWKWQDKLGVHRFQTSYSDKRSTSCRYLRWVANLWQVRAKDTRRTFRARVRFIANLNSNPRRAICHTFGRYCSEALRVSGCETGWTYSTGAQNGQYLGLFQMGSWERSLFGHGPTAMEQCKAAYAYFVASGRDWSPWECQP